jgi:predicted Zn finger-like uncharacterized protein
VNYRTTCPHCASVFRLGADQLGAAQGWVQCSVCGAAFDARPSLLMEDGSPLPPPEPAPVEVPAPAEAPPAEAIPPEAAPAQAPEHAVYEETPEPAEPPRGIARREAALDLDSIILIEPDIPASEDYGPLPQIYPAPTSYPPPPAVQPAPAAKPAPAARVEYAAPLPGKARRALARPRLTPWMWGSASALLAVVLLAQTTYFLRDTLAGRLPQTRPTFERMCAALGCTLSLPKDLAQLQIVGSDLQTEAPARGTPEDAPLLRSDPSAAPARGTPGGGPLLRSDPSAASGRLRLTLTLGNRANQAQAWPVLVLTLTDQRNRPLARRSFAPSEYLGDARRIAAGIPPRSEQVLNLPLTVRGPAPMGFDLQLTY